MKSIWKNVLAKSLQVRKTDGGKKNKEPLETDPYALHVVEKKVNRYPISDVVGHVCRSRKTKAMCFLLHPNCLLFLEED